MRYIWPKTMYAVSGRIQLWYRRTNKSLSSCGIYARMSNQGLIPSLMGSAQHEHSISSCAMSNSVIYVPILVIIFVRLDELWVLNLAVACVDVVEFVENDV